MCCAQAVNDHWVTDVGPSWQGKPQPMRTYYAPRSVLPLPQLPSPSRPSWLRPEPHRRMIIPQKRQACPDYFVVSEALTKVAKHSHAGLCVIGLRHRAGTLRTWVTDDGVGGAALDKGHGLRGLEDRLLSGERCQLARQITPQCATACVSRPNWAAAIATAVNLCRAELGDLNAVHAG